VRDIDALMLGGIHGAEKNKGPILMPNRECTDPGRLGREREDAHTLMFK
jgi:hypothetical protein